MLKLVSKSSARILKKKNLVLNFDWFQQGGNSDCTTLYSCGVSKLQATYKKFVTEIIKKVEKFSKKRQRHTVKIKFHDSKD
jgi:hypothetical protein